MPGTSRATTTTSPAAGTRSSCAIPMCCAWCMDSLRYWVEEMGVDGFRFDLATTLARVDGEFTEHANFLDAVAAGPGTGLGQADRRTLGHRARAAIRSATFRPAGRSGTTATAIPCAASGRATTASCRSSPRGFRAPPTSTIGAAGGPGPASTSSLPMTASRSTTSSLTTSKHNEANQEDNRDGSGQQPQLELRGRGPQRRRGDQGACDRSRRATSWPPCCSLRACRCCWRGDEIGRSQGGNNNTYCQDSEIGWMDWTGIADEEATR